MLCLFIPPPFTFLKQFQILYGDWIWKEEEAGSTSDCCISGGLEAWQKPKDRGYEKKWMALSSVLEEQAMGLGLILLLKIGER